MTPEELNVIEHRMANSLSFGEMRHDGRALSTALRIAWAERDEARVAYVEAAKQRNEAESRHAFCDENKADLRAHRDRLEKELEVATMPHFAAASVRPEDWDDHGEVARAVRVEIYAVEGKK